MQAPMESDLLQDGLPVAYASAALALAQQWYKQIKKELLAVLFASDSSTNTSVDEA